MSVPISARLLCCADMVPHKARVADIGTDHGYLGIHLLTEGTASYVAACDLREGPLQSARRNAARHQIGEEMAFFLSDGLAKVDPDSVDTIVCAGMGGDLIAQILSAAPWLQDERYTLILQPQSSIQDLRAWLGSHGFYEERAELVKDGGFIYCVLRLRWGSGMELTPGQQFASPTLLASQNPLLKEYIPRLRDSLLRIIEGLSRAEAGQDPRRLKYLRTAVAELTEMEENYVNRL